jgi:hypothetical protein
MNFNFDQSAFKFIHISILEARKFRIQKAQLGYDIKIEFSILYRHYNKISYF